MNMSCTWTWTSSLSQPQMSCKTKLVKGFSEVYVKETTGDPDVETVS